MKFIYFKIGIPPLVEPRISMLSANATCITSSRLHSRYQSLFLSLSLSSSGAHTLSFFLCQPDETATVKSGKILFSCAITSAASAYNRCVIGQTDEISFCSRRRAVNGAFFGRNTEFSVESRRLPDSRIRTSASRGKR